MGQIEATRAEVEVLAEDQRMDDVLDSLLPN
jgi:hypothetical protein